MGHPGEQGVSPWEHLRNPTGLAVERGVLPDRALLVSKLEGGAFPPLHTWAMGRGEHEHAPAPSWKVFGTEFPRLVPIPEAAAGLLNPVRVAGYGVRYTPTAQ